MVQRQFSDGFERRLNLPALSEEERRQEYDALAEVVETLQEADTERGFGTGVSGSKASDLLRAIAYSLPQAAAQKLGAFDVDAVQALMKLSRQLETVGC